MVFIPHAKNQVTGAEADQQNGSLCVGELGRLTRLNLLLVRPKAALLLRTEARA